MPRKLFLACISLALSFSSLPVFAQQQANTHPKLTLRNAQPIRHGADRAAVASALEQSRATNTLPTWNYQVISTRDGNIYTGTIVGANPTARGNDSVNVPGQLIPIILHFHTIGTGITNQGIVTTKKGNSTSNPTVADNACLAAPNNVPVDVVRQSPVFQNANFNFGGTPVGVTQYTDAYQRARFWDLIDKSSYHVRVAPLKVFPAVVVDVPAASGLSLSKNVLGTCGPLGIIDINLVDAVAVQATLQTPGVNPKTFPMFLFYNAAFSEGDPTNLANCCAGGYHSINPTGPVTFQTYSPFDFDTTGAFGPSALDSAIMSHEVAEWMNDPYVVNPTPAWGHIGQVNFCQDNLEVADPLTGTNISPIVGKNGFTYHLQELAFFSWFYSSPSIGLHGWFSNNGTFMTDAGPPCK